jgi:hypothetical protein
MFMGVKAELVVTGPSRMLKKSASGVLALFRSSTGTRPPH